MSRCPTRKYCPAITPPRSTFHSSTQWDSRLGHPSLPLFPSLPLVGCLALAKLQCSCLHHRSKDARHLLRMSLHIDPSWRWSWWTGNALVQLSVSMQPHFVSTHLSLSMTWVTTRSSKTTMRVSGEAVVRTPSSHFIHVASPWYGSVHALHHLMSWALICAVSQKYPKAMHLENMHTNDHLHGRHVVTHLSRTTSLSSWILSRDIHLVDKTKKNIPFHKVYDVRYVHRPHSHPGLTSCKWSHFSPQSGIINALL